jgi:hypothetical protein
MANGRVVRLPKKVYPLTLKAKNHFDLILGVSKGSTKKISIYL